MASYRFSTIPDVAISETATTSAVIGFVVLAIAFFAGLAAALWYRKKRERDGIYSKYKLPGDPQKVRR